MTATSECAPRAAASLASSSPGPSSLPSAEAAPQRATIRFWAGARQAAGHAQEPTNAASIAELRQELASKPRMRAIAEVASFLLDGQQADDSAPIQAGSVIDVLPPFAGG